jgi:hypothetical protein
MAPFSRRLEIAFWTNWVSALRLLQNVPWAMGLRIVVVCSTSLLLVLGLAGFLRYGLPESAANRLAQIAAPAAVSAAPGAVIGSRGIGRVVLPKSALPVEHPKDTQVNVLFLLVDRLGSLSPQLLGAWLMVGDPQNQKLTFLPLFPSVVAGGGVELNRNFRLDPSGAPSPVFLESVKQKGVWWHHYLIFDKAALSALVELEGGVGLGDGLLSGAKAVAALPPAGQAAREILEGQAALLEAICQRSESLFTTANPMLVAGLLAGADRSDISPETFQQGWQQVSHSGGLVCEFPTVLGR